MAAINGRPARLPRRSTVRQKELTAELPSDALRRTVQEIPPGQNAWTAATAGIWYVAQQADDFVPWGANVKARDAELRRFAMTEPVFASALGVVAARNAAFSWKLSGDDEKKVERYQKILQMANFGRGWADFALRLTFDLSTQDSGAFFEVIRSGNSPDSEIVGIANLDAAHCLGRDSRVLLADGSTKAIVQMVRERDPGPVMALGPDGQLHPRPVTGWYENKLGERYWLRLRLKGARHVFGKREGLWLTNDHEILTSDGWQRAEHLSLGSRVVTEYATPNAAQTEMLVGTLLGDAGLVGATPDRKHIQIGHAAKQEEWLDLKKEALAGFGWSETHGDRFRQSQTEATPGLATLGQAFYPGDGKVVPRDLVEANFGPRLLAAWYGDDGTMQTGRWGRPKSRFYTNGFSREDNEWLAALLTSRGFPAVVREHRYNVGPYAGRSYPHLFLGAEATERLFATIAPYLPECLRYKLPGEAAPFRRELWELGTADRWAAEVESLERGDNGQQTATFCIDVEEDHNFVAGGAVVHNCQHTGLPETPVMYQDRLGRYHLLKWFQVVTLSEMPATVEELPGIQYCALTRMLRAVRILKDISIYLSEKVGGRQTRAITLLQGVTAKQVEDALSTVRFTNDSVGLMRYSQPVMVSTVDPNAEVDFKMIELASIPDGFDLDLSFKQYVAQIAMAFRSDYQEFAPLPGGNLGTSSQSEILHLKSRGKGPGLWMKLIATAINWWLLPDDVTFEFDEQDPEADSTLASVKLARAQERQVRLLSGEITPTIARQLAVEAGDLTPEQADELNKHDEEEAAAPPAPPTTPEQPEEEQPGQPPGDEVVDEEDQPDQSSRQPITQAFRARPTSPGRLAVEDRVARVIDEAFNDLLNDLEGDVGDAA